MRKFEKKYCYKKSCYEVDKNLKNEHLDEINRNKNIRVISVSGGMESPAHINFVVKPKTNLIKAENQLKKKLPNSEIECGGWSKGGYNLDKHNKDYRGKKRKPVKKVCSVISKKKKSSSWWARASKVVGRFH